MDDDVFEKEDHYQPAIVDNEVSRFNILEILLTFATKSSFIVGNTETRMSSVQQDAAWTALCRQPAAHFIFHRAASAWPVLWLSGFTATAGCSPQGSPKVKAASFILPDLLRITEQ